MPAIAHNFSLGPRAFWPFPRHFDESTLVNLVRIHPQAKQKYKEVPVQNKLIKGRQKVTPSSS
jgi:hypothetical protein